MIPRPRNPARSSLNLVMKCERGWNRAADGATRARRARASRPRRALPACLPTSTPWAATGAGERSGAWVVTLRPVRREGGSEASSLCNLAHHQPPPLMTELRWARRKLNAVRCSVAMRRTPSAITPSRCETSPPRRRMARKGIEEMTSNVENAMALAVLGGGARVLGAAAAARGALPSATATMARPTLGNGGGCAEGSR